mmetsp:Transcript_8287/g.24581  ORF Transcript_8287/g.24581 Transcript_8287/m.24581 type:complete len:239 (+) Transcript_8287:301-1017(+)
MPSTTIWQAPPCVPIRSLRTLLVKRTSNDCKRLDVAASRTTTVWAARAGFSANKAATLVALHPHWQWYATRFSWPSAFCKAFRECARKTTMPSLFSAAEARPVRANSFGSLSGCNKLSCSLGGILITVSLPSSSSLSRALAAALPAPLLEAACMTCFIRATSSASPPGLFSKPFTLSGNANAVAPEGEGPYTASPASASASGSGGTMAESPAEKPDVPIASRVSFRFLRRERDREDSL